MVHSVGLLDQIAAQDRRGSPRFRDASLSARAVLSDPAGVSSSLASGGSLVVPSKFSSLSASGLSSHEAQSLHIHSGLDLAWPTPNQSSYVHETNLGLQVT